MITIPKAREILENYTNNREIIDAKDFDNAIKLAVKVFEFIEEVADAFDNLPK